MAYFNETHASNAGLAERIVDGLAQWLAGVGETMARRRLARVTYTELSALSNRELADLGISRSEIRALALKAAQGKL